ncbi:MAG: FkbM family methyltransferase [Longimicrobiales bacterium]|nr:FkbM family methyltransferase [Longimicrobiales bacterium]
MTDTPARSAPRRYPGTPWGAYPPGRTTRLLIALTRRVPTLPLIRQLVFPLRRLARWRHPGPLDHHLWGHRLRFRPSGNIAEGRLLFLPDRWDLPERTALAERLRPGATFVDVGANFGGYTWWVLSRLGTGVEILALEPDPEMHEGLRFNLEVNGIRNVTALPLAAGTEVGVGELRIDPGNRGENSLLGGASSDGGGSTRAVAVRPLAQIVREWGVDRIDAMKIDIEGMEPPVLDLYFDEAPRRIWPRLLIVERGESTAHAALTDRLRRLGYRTLLVTRMNLVVELR